MTQMTEFFVVGSYGDTVSIDPAYARGCYYPSYSHNSLGFRPALYFGEPIIVEPPAGGGGAS